MCTLYSAQIDCLAFSHNGSALIFVASYDCAVVHCFQQVRTGINRVRLSHHCQLLTVLRTFVRLAIQDVHHFNGDY